MLIDAGQKTWMLGSTLAGVLALALFLCLDQAPPQGLASGGAVGWRYAAGSLLTLVAAEIGVRVGKLPWWCWVLCLLGVLAAGIGLALTRPTPGSVTGGTTVGLWYGLAGAALLLYAGLLAAHRQMLRLSRLLGVLLRWLPARQWWLRGHIWLGLLSAVVLLCHSGFQWGGPLECVLWGVFGATLATGILGVLLQQFLPRLLTTQISAEAPYEQIPHICQVLRRKADQLVEEICAAPTAAEAGQELRDWYQRQVKPFLGETYQRSSPLANPVRCESLFAQLHAAPRLAAGKDKIEQLAGFCEVRRQLGEQERLHHWMHGWLLVHVPLSVALLVLGVAHAVMALYY